MTMLLLKSSPKIPKSFILGGKLRDFSFFHEIVQMYKFWGAEFKYSESFFTILPAKCPNKVFSVSNLGSFFFWEVLQTDKFHGADFKYDNSICHNNTQIRHFR